MSSRGTLQFRSLNLALALVALGYGCDLPTTRTCYSNGTCVNPDGSIVDKNGNPIVQSTTTGGTTGGGTTGSNNPNYFPPVPPLAPNCHCTPTSGPLTSLTADNDGDCIPNAAEKGSAAQVLHNGVPTGNPNFIHSGDPMVADTDGDGIPDGCEDRNHNGIWDPGEEDPTNDDTDNDVLNDGLEDANHNGVLDPGETSAIRADSDYDGIDDGVEDRNHNGVCDAWVDVNHNGVFDAGVDTAGETDPRYLDTDGDQIPDPLEDKNRNGVYDPSPALHETIAWYLDTDGDGISDGLEDKNHNGDFDPGETDPTSTDTDGDGLADGVEDINHNGRWDAGTETNPILRDTDTDGILDGIEDLNRNGKVDAFVDSNGNGCWDPGEPAGESDPRKVDTDGDGLADGLEDVNHNGLCDAPNAPSPLNPAVSQRTFVETCAWLQDTDCDGLTEGLEDKNLNASVDLGETDPRNPDTDFDTLTDGCHAGTSAPGCEDKNNNGSVDAGETDPTRPDSDGDLLPDGCEYSFGPHPPAGGTNPLSQDSDGDGVPDGTEDANHDCVYQPDLGETDPRVYDSPPAASSANFTEWSICSPLNLNGVSFAASARPTHDFRLALEIEQANTGPCGSGGACPAGETCIDNVCVLTASYSLQPYGKDVDGNGFNANDPNDLLYGYVFESPQGIVTDPVTGTVLSRDVYGFVQISEDTRGLDDILDSVRNAFTARYGATGTVSEVASLPSRPAFDSVSGYPVNFAQRAEEFAFSAPQTALSLRNDILVQQFLGGQSPDPAGTPPATDPVYGLVSACSLGVPQCYTSFRLYVGAVQRPNQKGPTGKPVVITVVALTPDDSNPAQPALPANRFFADRVIRLEDLTGGSAVARYAADTGHACDHRPQNMARADMLWVVDDSRSMQQLIQHLQSAALSAQQVLTANSGIVDIRVGMTTSNPSQAARTQCLSTCTSVCGGPAECGSACADQTLGCIKTCPSTCTESCPTSTSCTCSTCGRTLTNQTSPDCCPGDAGDSNNQTAYCAAPCAHPGQCSLTCDDPSALAGPTGLVAADAQIYSLPGGGGTFYYESTGFMDCSSSDPAHSSYKDFLNLCNQSPWSANAGVQQFFGGTNGGVLKGNAGMLHSDPTAACTLLPLDLYYDTAASSDPMLNTANPGCANPNINSCCLRLLNTCTDGPTVLASQMCDLIRQMGGVPGNDGGGITSSGRRHSSHEMGTRSALRLINSMLPAFPYNYADPTSPLYDPNSVGHMRLACAASSASDPNCAPCDPRTSANCVTLPLATVFISDEEDFYFKNECFNYPGYGNSDSVVFSEGLADRHQLRNDCLYVDGDPNTIDSCSANYCQGILGNPNYPNSTWPSGYNPDQTAMTSDGFFTMQWTAGNASQCSPTNPHTCIEDPCPFLTSQSACNGSSYCAWNPNYTDWNGATQNWAAQPWPAVNAQCVNRCALHVADWTITQQVNVEQLAANQRAACEADPMCMWDQSQVSLSDQSPYQRPPGPCVLRHPVSDCQACKRYVREQQAFYGTTAGTPTLGFAQAGPVYAIIRNKGAPGSGGITQNDAQDACGGGLITWGRGDGQAYRDLAIMTEGRTQDVCAPNYSDFMQLVTADLAVLSTPYPLTQRPIASTIKVGLQRPNGDGTYTYIPEKRSDTTGFLYDATRNTIGFKSDPVDGACAPGAGCSANGIIEPSEILYARTAPTVPKPGDIVWASYRIWNPVPCGGQCPVGQSCLQEICKSGDGTTCAANCVAQHEVCALGQCCTPGTLVQGCVDTPQCGTCQVYNPNTHVCQDMNDLCACNPGSGQSCSPNGENTCPIGFGCDETCICHPVPGCAAGTFNTDGTVSNCTAALACCATFAQNANASGCAGLDPNHCTGNCIMQGNVCAYKYQTCCPPTSSAGCATDPESGQQSIFCNPAACNCAALGCVPPQECDPGACVCYVNPNRVVRPDLPRGAHLPETPPALPANSRRSKLRSH